MSMMNAVIDALSEAGVDLIELGIPYGDPLADGTLVGPLINERAYRGMAQALEEATREAHRAGDEPQTRSHAEGAVPLEARDSQAPVPVAHGEGIGLAIVKRLCELLEATLELDSRPVGTTFRVSLPRKYS